MDKLAARLLIGEKIGFGFGFVGLLFLLVIWQYHSTLKNSLEDYQHLQDVFEAKKSHAHAIMNSILAARVAEKSFLSHRLEESATKLREEIDSAFSAASKLEKIDSESALTARQISELLEIYQVDFEAVEKAWRTMGLNHNLGLQGAFRDAVHELESMAAQHKVGALYLQLLQIRRGEKDLGLRREEQYYSKVLDLIQEFQEKVFATELEEKVKRLLLAESNAYREAFEDYSAVALRGGDIGGGKGRFRDVAHRIEALINQHYVPDLEATILQLRRREKDYLLRDDKRYVDMAIAELNQLQTQVDRSTIPDADKTRFGNLLNNYRGDFLALVEQNDHIAQLTKEMEETVSKISALTQNNVEVANQAVNEVVAEINVRSAENERLMLWIAAIATILGIVLAVVITLHISRPLRRMAGMLDRLAYEEPTERMSFVPGGRDEVNAMAVSVNTMADHRERFIDWWKVSMQEAEACQSLEQLLKERESEPEGLMDAEWDLRRAMKEKQELTRQQCNEVRELSRTIVGETERLLGERPSGEQEIGLNSIRHSAKSIQSFLEILSHQETQKAPTDNA